MSAIAAPCAPSIIPELPASPLSPSAIRKLLHDRMLETGYAPDDIAKIESALVSVHLHDAYLRAGYSPDDIAALTSLY
jgi:hypothetical protein